MRLFKGILIAACLVAAFLIVQHWFIPKAPAQAPSQNQLPVSVLPSASSTLTASGASTTTPQESPQPVAPQKPVLIGETGPFLLSGFYRTSNNSLPSLEARRYVVADLQTGDRFAQLHYTGRWPMASITKLMTAVVAIETLEPQANIDIGLDDFPEDSAGNPQYVKVGERYSLEDLMRLMLLVSSNEAAEAIASVYNRAQFIAAMNAKAQEWGMGETYFDDPTGLSVSNQSTLQDLEAMTLHIYKEYPRVFAITRMPTVRVKELQSGVSRDIISIISFAGRSDFIGGKTGRTDEAGGNLLSLFSHRGRPIIVIVLGTSDRFGETQRLYQWWKNTFAFRNPQP